MTNQTKVSATSATKTDMDPVTFEVMRHRLWAINDEQAMMAARVSGSPVVYEAFDFNTSILTHDGRALFAGVYILPNAVPVELMVRYVLEKWPLEDIREGDMFSSNDPWSGALHANDTILVSPVFWEGEIVAWTGIVMHDSDVGSPVPGSFVVGAQDRFGEAPLVPGIKLVENFKVREDLEQLLLRNVRTPELNALNMRARVAALTTTHHRIHDLISQYGRDDFIQCQEEIINYVERVLRQRLREIPDGSWYEQAYMDHDSNENKLYKVCCRLTKHGDSLTVDFRGTAPQVQGSVNCSRAGLEGGAFTSFLTFLCYDLPWSIGAVRNVVEIISDEGTINNAQSPAAVSMGSVMGTWITQDIVGTALSKMLLCHSEYRQEAQACWQPSINGEVVAGLGRDGVPFASVLMDCCGGGGGARTFADGIDSGGFMQSMKSGTPNVETTESRYPVMQVYRRQRIDSAGAGRYRGGVSIEYALLPHKNPVPVEDIIFAHGISQPEGHGLAGGAPSSVGLNLIRRGSDVFEQMKRGFVPNCSDEISGEDQIMEAKDATALEAGDCHICLQTGGGGYGDPLRREPASVEQDVRRGLVSAESAKSIYGVILESGVVNEVATKALRSDMYAERLRQGRSAGKVLDKKAIGGEVLHPVGDTVEAALVKGKPILRCTECNHQLSDYDGDFKHGTLVRELPITAASPINSFGLVDDVLLREFICPGCGTSVAMDVQIKGEEILDEVVFGDADRAPHQKAA